MLRPGAMVPRLRLDAVPSIFNGFPKHLKERLERKKKKKADDQVVIICNQMETQNTDRVSKYTATLCLNLNDISYSMLYHYGTHGLFNEAESNGKGFVRYNGKHLC